MVKEIHRGITACLQLAENRGATCLVVAGWSAGAQLIMQVDNCSICAGN